MSQRPATFSEAGPYWAVAQVVSGQEAAVAERFKLGRMPLQHRFDTFIPLDKRRRLFRRKFVNDTPPAFTGYVFFFIARRTWHAVLDCEGVIQVVMDEASPAAVPADWMAWARAEQALKGFCTEAISTKFSPGQRVRVSKYGDAMDGHEGRYFGLSKQDRVRALFNLLGRQVSVELDEGDLIAA